VAFGRRLDVLRAETCRKFEQRVHAFDTSGRAACEDPAPPHLPFDRARG
jgi:hypothetical protein